MVALLVASLMIASRVWNVRRSCTWRWHYHRHRRHCPSFAHLLYSVTNPPPTHNSCWTHSSSGEDAQIRPTFACAKIHSKIVKCGLEVSERRGKMGDAPIMRHSSDFWEEGNGLCSSSVDGEASNCVRHPGDGASYVLIVVNCLLPAFTPSLWRKARLRVCADGGANRLYHQLPRWFQSEDPTTVLERFIPDAIIGDLDSIESDVKQFYTSKGSTVIDKSDDQDTTDLHKCVTFIENSTPDLHCTNLKLIVVGALGGRFDHEISNINVLYSFPNIRIALLSDSTMLFLLPRGYRHEIKIRSSVEGPHCGLIPVGAPSQTTTTTGLKWNLDRTAMAFGSLISTCNLVQSQIVTVLSDADLLWTITIQEEKYS